MSERTPLAGALSFAYGRIASPDREVLDENAQPINELTAEYTIGPDGGPWGTPSIILTDSHGALLTRPILLDGFGEPITIIAWDIAETTHVLALNAAGQSFAAPSASVLYGQTDRADPEAQFEQLQVLSDASADNFTTARGTQVVCKPGQWNSRVTAAENVLATVTRAAGGASLRHVVQGFEFTLSGAGNSPQDLTCRIRDGAGGTILWESYIFKDLAGQSVTIRVDDISLPMTVNTAMVAEFSAAAGANTFQSINVRGITVD